MAEQDQPVRIDKWLWAARLFKTRGLAAAAAGGGKIEMNGERAKPSRSARAGDSITVRRGPYEWIVIVKNVARLRGPAAHAQVLYDETEESLRQRQTAAAQLQLERPPQIAAPGRPTKRDQRAISRFTKPSW
jgi:ribosome-associated heat shock protein Hsp15